MEGPRPSNGHHKRMLVSVVAPPRFEPTKDDQLFALRSARVRHPSARRRAATEREAQPISAESFPPRRSKGQIYLP